MWGYVAQHRLVVEDVLGRPLTRAEEVHHKDENPLHNAPDNLEVLSKSAHRRLHALARGAQRKSQLTEQMVDAALQGRSIHEAARALGVDPQTLRNRFPALLAPRQRTSPTRLDDPEVVALVRAAAADPQVSYKAFARNHGIAWETVRQICAQQGIPWTRKSKKGELHRQYRRKSASQSVSAPGA